MKKFKALLVESDNENLKLQYKKLLKDEENYEKEYKLKMENFKKQRQYIREKLSARDINDVHEEARRQNMEKK